MEATPLDNIANLLREVQGALLDQAKEALMRGENAHNEIAMHTADRFVNAAVHISEVRIRLFG